MKEKLRHRLNPLHVYCRLVDLGVSRARAGRICAVYEKFYARVL